RITVDAHSARVALEDSREDSVEEHTLLVTLEAFARRGDRRLHEVSPFARREAAMELFETGEQPGHGDGPFADVEYLRPRVTEVDHELLHLTEPRRGHAEEAVEHRRRAVRLVHEREAAARGAGQRALGHERRESGGEERVDRIAALAQDARSRFCGQGMSRCDRASHAATLLRFRRQPVFRNDGSSVSVPPSDSGLISKSGRPARRLIPPSPVATTVTQTCPVSRGSTVAPKMMFVSSVAVWRTTSAASLTSTSDRSSPPEIESRIPRARTISASMSGDPSARSAASRARFCPVAYPMPMSAEPASCMTVRTSAKSRLMRPGVVIKSQMPCTPWRSTSSAILNASTIEVERSSTSSSRSFGITMTVSQAVRSSSTPLSAAALRRVPSNRKGVVTIPTVSAPPSG